MAKVDFKTTDEKKKGLKLAAQRANVSVSYIMNSLEIDEKDVYDVVAYSNALNLLDDYDHGCINKPTGILSTYELTYEECLCFN